MHARSTLTDVVTIVNEIADRHDDALASLQRGLMPQDVSYLHQLSAHTIEQLDQIKRLISQHIDDEFIASTKPWGEVATAVLGRAREKEVQ